MKNILFVCGHIHAGTDLLISALNENNHMNIQKFGLVYDHPSVLDYLFTQGHKINDVSAVYGDELLYNSNFGSKAFYRFTNFIFLIRKPKVPLSKLLESKKFNLNNACRHYCFRLRRIYEMVYQSKSTCFLTWEDLFDQQAMTDLGTKMNCSLQAIKKPEEEQLDVPLQALKECEKCYEKYLYNIKTLIRHQTGR